MASQVYFTSLRTGYRNSLLAKIERLALAAGLEDIVRKGGLTAVKLHFGERGGTAFIRPVLVRPIVDALLKAGFTKVDVPEVQLFPGEINRVSLYRKDVATGERLRFSKFVVSVMEDALQVAIEKG